MKLEQITESGFYWYMIKGESSIVEVSVVGKDIQISFCGSTTDCGTANKAFNLVGQFIGPLTYPPQAERLEAEIEGKQQWDELAGIIGANGDDVDDVFAKARMLVQPSPANTAAPVGVPVGMVLVPREPTEAMLKACDTIIQGYGAKLVYARMIGAAPPPPQVDPIPMILFCPSCHLQHIDAQEDEASVYGDGSEMKWTNPPHRSHLCQGCGTIWRPADVPTTGVAAIQTHGKNDSVKPSQTKMITLTSFTDRSRTQMANRLQHLANAMKAGASVKHGGIGSLGQLHVCGDIELELPKATAFCGTCQNFVHHHGDPDSIHLHLCDVCNSVVDY